MPLPIIAGAIIQGLVSNLGSIGTFFKDLRAAITGKEILDPTKLAEFEARAQELEFTLIQTQAEINKIEAASPSVFVAGWRPFIGWVCGIALFYHFMGYHLAVWGLTLANVTVQAPVLDTGSLLSVVMALLGLGGLRTFEKVKGVSSDH